MSNFLRHRRHIDGIVEGTFLPPVMVDVDPVDGVCNLDCAWCCQAASRASRPVAFMPVTTMQRLGPFCRDWGVQAWRIAGDSEPLLHRQIGELLLSGADAGIDMGLITNGVFVERLLDTAGLLCWLGISLDATTPETWARLKRGNPSDFHKIIAGVRRIRDKFPDLDLSLKFVRWSPVASLSKSDFHVCATGVPASGFPSADPRALANTPVAHAPSAQLPILDQTGNADDLDGVTALCEQLGVRPIVRDAYPANLASTYQFTTCRATPLGGVFAADHSFDLCCDARRRFVLTHDYTAVDWSELPRLWSGERHHRLIKSIDPTRCAGCAKAVLNDDLENVVGTSHRTPSRQVNFI